MMAGGLVLLFGVDRSLLLMVALSQVAAGSAEVMGRFRVVATAAAATLFVGLRTLGTTSTTTTSSSTTTAAATSATSTTTTTTTATTHRTGRTEEAWRLGSRLVNVEGREHVVCFSTPALEHGGRSEARFTSLRFRCLWERGQKNSKTLNKTPIHLIPLLSGSVLQNVTVNV